MQQEVGPSFANQEDFEMAMEYQGSMTRKKKDEAKKRFEEHMRWVRHEALRVELEN